MEHPCRLGSTAESYHRLGSKTAQGYCSSSLLMRARGYTQQLGMAAGLAHCPNRAVGWSLQQPGFSDQSFWSGRLGGYAQQHLAKSVHLASVAGEGHRTSFMASMAHWLGVQIRQNFHLSSLARWGLWLGSADGHSRWLVYLLRHFC